MGTLVAAAHPQVLSLQPQTATGGHSVTCPKQARNLADALIWAYRGPKAAERLAHDAGYSLSAAKLALSGQIPAAWGRFLAVIEKKPALLSRALKTTWADELVLKRELSTTKRRLEEIETQLREGATRRQQMERRVAKDSIDDRETAEQIGRVDRTGKVK